MMDRRKFLVLVTAFSLTGTMPAWADKQDDIVERLVEAGFGQIEITRTLLGRVRITGTKGNMWRELVINPRTGEILRDVTIVAEDGKSKSGSSQGGGRSSNSGSGSGDDKDDSDDGGDDDNDDDSDDDSDKSGSGNGSDDD
jgi:uncharacterized membrane protein YgcG